MRNTLFALLLCFSIAVPAADWSKDGPFGDELLHAIEEMIEDFKKLAYRNKDRIKKWETIAGFLRSARKDGEERKVIIGDNIHHFLKLTKSEEAIVRKPGELVGGNIEWEKIGEQDIVGTARTRLYELAKDKKIGPIVRRYIERSELPNAPTKKEMSAEQAQKKPPSRTERKQKNESRMARVMAQRRKNRQNKQDEIRTQFEKENPKSRLASSFRKRRQGPGCWAGLVKIGQNFAIGAGVVVGGAGLIWLLYHAHRLGLLDDNGDWDSGRRRRPFDNGWGFDSSSDYPTRRSRPRSNYGSDWGSNSSPSSPSSRSNSGFGGFGGSSRSSSSSSSSSSKPFSSSSTPRGTYTVPD